MMIDYVAISLSILKNLVSVKCGISRLKLYKFRIENMEKLCSLRIKQAAWSSFFSVWKILKCRYQAWKNDPKSHPQLKHDNLTLGGTVMHNFTLLTQIRSDQIN